VTGKKGKHSSPEFLIKDLIVSAGQRKPPNIILNLDGAQIMVE